MKKFGKLFLTLLAFLVCLPVISHISKPMASTKTYTLSDVQMILCAALHITEPINEYDLNQDDKVNISDARLCLKYVLGIQTPSTDTPPTPSENIPSSAIPATSTPKPTNLTPVPDTPYLSTKKITLSSDFTGTEATCAAITIHNITAYNPEISTDLRDYVSIYYKEGTCFVHPFYEKNQQLTAYETMTYDEDSNSWIRLDPVITFSEPIINGNSATFYITAVPYASGQFTIEIAYGRLQINENGWDREELFTCDVALSANLQNDITHTIITEDEIKIPIEKGQIISNLGDFGYVSGEAVYATGEGNFEIKDYDEDTYTHIKYNISVKETYLTTHGEYDPELTAQVREQLYQKPGYNYPQDQIDFLTNVAEQWYSGEISYRTLRNTFRNTYRDGWVSIGVLDYIDEDGNKHYNYHHYSMNDWGNHGYGQDSKIFKIDGKIDVPTIKSTLNQMAGSWGYGTPGICFVRVHYDKSTDTSYIYFIP